MRRSLAASFLFSILVSAPLFAQTTSSNTTNVAPVPDWFIVGHGTAGTIPRFVTPFKIADSNIIQSSNGNIGIGTATPLFPLHIFTNSVTPPTGQDFPVALFVESAGSLPSKSPIAIEGLASAGSGFQIGVDGVTFSPDGVGVLGNHPTNDGGGSGVVGLTNSVTGFSTGVSGVSNGNTGPGVGIFGQSFSPQGIAGLFINRPGGDILHGAVSQNPDITVFRVDGTGRVFANGGFQPSGADFAESMEVKGNSSKYVAGDLLEIDVAGNRRLTLALEPYSTLVAGVYSTRPGMLGSTHMIDEHAVAADEVPLAVVGIVPCKVSAENGPIQPGDLLVSSSTPGHAMKGTDRSLMLGAVVGKALEPLQKGTGVIQVLVTLQ
jgi:hypothetical protein